MRKKRRQCPFYPACKVHADFPCAAFSIRVPVIKGKDITLLRQNYLNEQMLKTHPHEIIGYISCTIRLDPGLVSTVVLFYHVSPV